MKKKFINNFLNKIKFLLTYLKKKIRILFFDYKYYISQFSNKTIQTDMGVEELRGAAPSTREPG